MLEVSATYFSANNASCLPMWAPKAATTDGWMEPSALLPGLTIEHIKPAHLQADLLALSLVVLGPWIPLSTDKRRRQLHVLIVVLTKRVLERGSSFLSIQRAGSNTRTSNKANEPYTSCGGKLSTEGRSCTCYAAQDSCSKSAGSLRTNHQEFVTC